MGVKCLFHSEGNHFGTQRNGCMSTSDSGTNVSINLKSIFKRRKKQRRRMMSESKKKIEVKVERTIPAAPADVFDAWLDPKVPGNPWNMAEKLLLNPHVDGFFYWL